MLQNHNNILKSLERKYKGQRCFIIGGGPSINHIHLDMRKAYQDEMTIGVTKAYSILTPNFLVWTDAYFWNTYMGDIAQLKCTKICPTTSVSVPIADQYGITVFQKGPKTAPLIQNEFNGLNIRNNSGVTALRMAYIMGFNPIYLVGIDMNNDDTRKGITHFHDDYKKDNIKRYDKTCTADHYDSFYTYFEQTIREISKRGVSVISCSSTSRLNTILEYRDIQAVLELGREELCMRRPKLTTPVKVRVNPKTCKTGKPRGPKCSTGKQKILFAVTPSGWAYHNRCLALQERLSQYYDITIESNTYAMKYGHMYDLVYISGFEAYGKSGFRPGRSVCTIGGLVVKTLQQAVDMTKSARALAIPNMRWFDDFKRFCNQPVFYISNGVDTKKFVPKLKKDNEKFVVGWVGNDRPHRIPIKRINILRDVCYKIGVNLVEHNWGHNNIPHNKMPEYYKNIDLFCHTSITEGSSNPILEACSCGIPVLATPVGNAPELVESGLELLSMDLSDLASKIKEMQNIGAEKRQKIGEKLRQRMVDEFDWDIIAEKYRTMFETALK